jgi:hypothetical protein
MPRGLLLSPFALSTNCFNSVISVPSVANLNSKSIGERHELVAETAAPEDQA